MALLVTGTVAQRYIGLYDAQKMFFSSFVLWLGPLPLPGAYTLIGIILCGLLCKFLFATNWSWQKAGSHLAHLGVIILLLGGLVTALKAEEGYLVIPEGAEGRFVSDYHQRALFIVRNGQLFKMIAHQDFFAGADNALTALPFQLTVLEQCRNCKVIDRSEANASYKDPLRGMAEFMALVPQKPENEEEKNLYGATVRLSGAGAEIDGVYVLFEAMPEPLSFRAGGDRYELIFGKAQRELPFRVQLDDFEEQLYPGTGKARSYHSDVTVIDQGVAWPARIEMNKPLRYRGYTLFQSSFIQDETGTATVLAVVKNSGWLFPYIGTGVVAAGLLLHALLMIFKSGRRRI